MNICNNLRNKMINKLITIFESEENEVKKKEMATIIEKSVYNFFENWIKTHPQSFKLNKTLCRNLYTSKMRQIYHFFKKNSYIKYNNAKILRNKKKLQNIAYIHYKELCPAKWNLFFKDSEILDKKIVNSSDNIQTTDVFQCGRCKQNNCVYTEAQTRSCDESATIFVKCMNCYHSFRG